MVNFASVIVLALSFTAFATPGLNRTALDIEVSISKCRGVLDTLSSDLLEFSRDPALGLAIAIHTEGVKLGSLLESTTEAFQATPPVPLDEASRIVGLVQGLGSPILASLSQLIDDKENFDNLLPAGLGGVVKADVGNLHIAFSRFSTVFEAFCPTSLKTTANAFISPIEAKFQKCIGVYQGE